MSLSTPTGAPPVSPAAEWAVIARMMSQPEKIGEIVAAPLSADDFSQPETRLLFTTTTNRHYASKPVDPLVIGELVREDLANFWSADPSAISEMLVARVRDAPIGNVAEHAAIVKRLSTSRKLMNACNHALIAIQEGKLSPEEIGDKLGTETLTATAGSIRRSEILNWMDVGTEYAKHLQRLRAARDQGLEVGVYTGMPFFDQYTAGIGAGELCFLAGDPGVGKTALAAEGSLGFASRQLARPAEHRVATLFVSCEMGLNSSTARIVSRLTGLDGMDLREGAIDDQGFQRFLSEWSNRRELPLYWNFASNFKLSQLRALIAEAIRRHNVGFVILDHFRMVDTDRRYQNGLDADEAKVRFLKENIAKDLNVAVLCLAHTVKVGRGAGGESPRPRLSDLRGSGQIAAFADFVAIAWNPGRWSGEEDIGGGLGSECELLWVKNRYGDEAVAPYRFIGNEMRVESR